MFLPLELTLRPSRFYPALLALAHALALLGIGLAALPFWGKALAVLALLAGMLWLWREQARQPRALRVSRSGRVELLEGEWRPARIEGRPVVLPWLVSLKLVQEGGRSRRLRLWADSAEAEPFRKLRVWLRWGAQDAG